MPSLGMSKPFTSMDEENRKIRHAQQVINKDITNIGKEAKVISTVARNIELANRRIKKSVTTSTTTTLPPSCSALPDKTKCLSRYDCVWENNMLGKKECQDDVNYYKTCYAFGRSDCDKQSKKGSRCSYRAGVCDPKGCESQPNWRGLEPKSPRRRSWIRRRRGALVGVGRSTHRGKKWPKFMKKITGRVGRWIRRRRTVSCFSYIWHDWCDLTGKTTRHWHQDWGSIDKWKDLAKHKSAAEACCGCGGGRSTVE